MPQIQTEDATLFCEVEGDGSPVTVFAHGLTNNRNELAAFTPLVPGTKIRFDFRGHGHSSSPAGGYRFERMVWLLPAGLDGPFPLASRYHALAGELEGKTPGEALEAVFSDPARLMQHLDTPWRLEYDRLLWHHDDPDGLARAIHGVVDDWPIPDREMLREVQIPTLIVCIGDDEIHPVELGRIFEELMPNGELIEFASQEELLGQIPELVARTSSFITGNA